MTVRVGPIVGVALVLFVIVRGCGAKDGNANRTPVVHSSPVASAPGAPVKQSKAAAAAPAARGGKHTFSAPISATVARALDDERASGWVTLVRKKSGPLKISASVKQECAPPALTNAIGTANRGGGDILVELRPLACDGVTASVHRLRGRDLATGIVRLPSLATADKKTCIATFEACLAPKGAASCQDQRTDGLLFSVPVVAHGRTVKAFAAGETPPERDALSVLQTKLSPAARVAVGAAVARARLTADLNMKGSSLGVELGYRTRAACSGTETIDVAAAGSRKP